MSTQQIALAPEISTWPDENPQLIGSTCGNCGATTFPVQQRCPKCSAGEMSDVLLPRRGTLVAWTTQGFPPGAPYKGPTGKDFVPFGVGLVQLDDVIRVEGRLTENDPAKLAVRPGGRAHHGAVRHRRRRQRDRHVRLPARLSREDTAEDTPNDVAIIGVGLHPFGRFDKTAMEMGADAIQSALTDAGVDWKDIQFGFGGSYEVSNPDAVTRLVGLTGITFANVFNACATAATAIQQTADTIRLGKYDIGIAIGLDKHPRGAFTDDPAKLALPQWYAENGQFVTTKFFGMKANHYIHKHGISQATLAKVAAKNFRNGEKNPNAFRRKPIPEDEILKSAGAELPAHAVHVLRPRRGRGGGDHVPRRHRAQVHRQARVRAGHRDPHPHVRRLRGARHIGTAGRGRLPDRVRGQGRLRGSRHRSRRTSTSPSCRTPTRAPRSSTWPRRDCAPTVTRRS